MRKEKLKGSLTIEMSIITPLILIIVMGLILSVFYFHDKNILNGAASETAVAGSIKTRNEEEITEEELAGFCRERMRGKCFFLTSQEINVSIEKEEVIVEIFAGKKNFKVSAVKKAVITEPEKKIRNIRRLDKKDGEKNND